MPNMIGLDFETYGAVNLPRHGLARYVSDPSFQALIGSVKFRNQHGLLDGERFNFVHYKDQHTELLQRYIGDKVIVAHNAGFEQAVLHWLGLDYPSSRFIDSAVVARGAGFGSGLEAAAPQILGMDKMAAGKDLIKLFSIPGPYQVASGCTDFDPQIIEDHPAEWAQFANYCELDADQGLLIAEDRLSFLGPQEMAYQAVTMDMNRQGWVVDIEKVEEMQRRYHENMDAALAKFHLTWLGPGEELNLNSLKQMKEWCAERGVKCTSFDEKHVAKYLRLVDQKLFDVTLSEDQRIAYLGVYDLLETKQILGGSSLKKLQVILDTVVEEDGVYRLKDQYVHVGAGQSARTTGRSVQMQNLKRLAQPADMDELDDLESEWSNGKLAENMRQVFTASEVTGELIVGDFKSVESRGLGWLASETYKLAAYERGQDLYKVLASTIYSVDYDDVTKEQRQTGKVGELSCGYGAGAGAVVSFAEGMGVKMTEAEAAKLVADWRYANPKIVELWDWLNDALHRCISSGGVPETLLVRDGYKVVIEGSPTPASLGKQHPGSMSIRLSMIDKNNRALLKRYFHGCYRRGGNIGYYKPSDRKTGDLWKNHFTDPKTKQLRFYELYGGKLAGILTQSLCREIFMRVLLQTQHAFAGRSEVNLVGQFHDEIVLDWKPSTLGSGLSNTMARLDELMSDRGDMVSFPLEADIKHDYRYTK
jgi:DNA polymerase